jgi:hypothetical protein
VHVTTVQAAIIAAATQIVSLLVSFAILSSAKQGIVISATTALVNAAFIIGQAVENHGSLGGKPSVKS